MLTTAQIEQAPAPVTGRRVLWDATLPGFGVRVFHSGQRSFIVRYRLPSSRTMQTATIGTYGLVTLPQARKRAQALLAKVRLGDDPQAERRARAATEAAEADRFTVSKLVAQYAAALQAGTANTTRLRGRQAAPKYVADTLHQLQRFAAAFGPQTADGVTRADVRRLLSAYAGQPSVHRLLHGAINRMYVWGRQHELVTARPTEDIETSAAPARERVLSLKELAVIWRAAEQLDPLYRDYVHLMILTGQRRAEVAGMVWGELDLARALWTLPTERTKARRAHILPLAPRAQAILQCRQAAFLRPPAAADLVMPTLGRDGKTVAPISGWNWLKRELDRLSGMTGWRLHDFRRSLVTHCAESGADVGTLDTLLNHASSATRAGVTGVYQRATLVKPMRAALERWEQLLRTALDDNTVVPLFPVRA